jgi:tetratricopeptide (TPR) repeat protein
MLLTFSFSAQEEPELAIALLENDDIADVNIDQDIFIKSLGEISELSKSEFKNVEASQKIAILIIFHPSGDPTIEFHSNPALEDKQKEGFLVKLKLLKFENTKLVYFPLLMLINSSLEGFKADFKELKTPLEKRQQEYQKATLKGKYELNKAYAIEVLRVLGAYQTIVDEQFAGVRNMGTLITKTNFNKSQNVSKLINENQDYWRAVLEMSPGNQLIPITKIFTYASQGEFDYAVKYMEVIRMFSDPKSVSDRYLEELLARVNMFNEELNERIQKGFSYHDTGKYQKAIDIYNEILKDYPGSAWAKYEVYFSQNALSVEKKKVDLKDRSEWDKSKVDIYRINPLYSMDVRASNGKEGYLLARRLSITELFKDKDKKITDIYEYANIALDLEVYDFAAQLYWISATYDKAENDAVFRFLYSIEKLGVTGLKSNFKGDFKQEFSKIEKTQEKDMKKSTFYKAFKK